MNNDTLFGRILRGEIPCDKVFEDDQVLAFRDINPAAPAHILVIPKKYIPTIDAAGPEDAELLGRLMLAAAEIARQQGLAAQGYRLVINCKDHGGQTVYHLHLHLLGGRALGWPPG